MGNLTEVEQEILNYLQTQVTLGKQLSLSQAAKECHVAPSTIVKLAKKIGYSGFVELQYQMMHQQEQKKAETFQTELVEGDLQKTLDALVEKLIECEDKKNIVCTMKNNDILASYFSRKLQMLEIFAPASYDYVMTSSHRLRKGIAFFFVKDAYVIHRFDMLKLAIQEGYYIVLVTEVLSEKRIKEIDMVIQMKKTVYKTADFFNVKVLIFMEMLLSAYANHRNLI